MDVGAGFNIDMDVEWPVNNRSSTISVVQFLLKTGSGTVKYIFL